jgi:hypothetical protein
MAKLNKPKNGTHKLVEDVAELEHPSDQYLDTEINGLLTEEESGKPTLLPPEGGIFSQGELTAGATWGTHKILSMWSNTSTMNTYIGLSNGVGWKKLSNSNPSAHRSLVAIAQGAYMTGSDIRYRLESDNEIHEIYAW